MINHFKKNIRATVKTTRGKRGYIMMYAVSIMAVVMVLLTVITSVVTAKNQDSIRNKSQFDLRLQVLALGDLFIGKNGNVSDGDLDSEKFIATVNENDLSLTVTNLSGRAEYLFIQLKAENGAYTVVAMRVGV